MAVQTYTNTNEGQEVLELLEHSISTHGMEVYKCEHCDEYFGGRPSEVEAKKEKILCGICDMAMKALHRMEHPEYLLEEEDDFSGVPDIS